MENLSQKHVLPTKLLLIPQKDVEKTTASGILIPETANKVSSLGTVVIVGSAVKDIEVGNFVMYSPHAAIKVKHEGAEYALLSNTDVLLFW